MNLRVVSTCSESMKYYLESDVGEGQLLHVM